MMAYRNGYIDSVLILLICCYIKRWRTTSRSLGCWACAIRRAPTCHSSRTPGSSGTSRWSGCWSCWRSRDRPARGFPPRSSLSIPSTVLASPLSRMGRPDALPGHRQEPLLGLRWRHFLAPRTSTTTQLFYSYNYNTFSTNIRYRTFRNVFPFLVAYIFADAYASYRKQILKINLFDEYCYLRSQELVKQNEYLLDHPGTTVVS